MPPSARILASGVAESSSMISTMSQTWWATASTAARATPRRIAVRVELGEHPAYLAVPVRGAEPGEGRHEGHCLRRRRRSRRASSRSGTLVPSSRAAQASVAPDDRMLPSRAYVGASVSQARVDGTGDEPATNDAVGVITDVPGAVGRLRAADLGAAVPEQGGMRVRQHRGDRHPVTDPGHGAADTEVAVRAQHLGQHGGRDVEQLQQRGGPGKIDDVVEQGA